MANILITDDDVQLRRLVRTYAERDGFQCAEAESGREALNRVRDQSFDLVVLDVMMPGLDGFQTLAEMRESSQVPVILLTARGEEYDRLLGLDLGADDYVTKPFSPRELMARFRAVLRRCEGECREEVLRFGSLTITPHAREVAVEEAPLFLTPKEYELLLVLCRNQHMVMSREKLLEKVWGYDYLGDVRTVDTHIKNLRDHLKSCRGMIQTVWGVGYQFDWQQH